MAHARGHESEQMKAFAQTKKQRPTKDCIDGQKLFDALQSAICFQLQTQHAINATL